MELLVAQSFSAFFSSDSSAASLSDADQDVNAFCSQLMRQDTESPDSSTALGFPWVSYVTQLANVLVNWHAHRANPMLARHPGIESVQQQDTSSCIIAGVSLAEVDTIVHACQAAEDDSCAHFEAIAAFIDRIGGARGILTLMGFRETVGSRTIAPLTRTQCLRSFQQVHKGEKLTVGARAFSKHCQRSTDGWWGQIKGNDEAKNAVAQAKLQELLDSAVWKNIHSLPHAQTTMEIRNALGYGARWYVEDESFRGFLEPPMANGHEAGWRH